MPPDTVPRAEYDKLLAELSTARADNERLRRQLDHLTRLSERMHEQLDRLLRLLEEKRPEAGAAERARAEGLRAAGGATGPAAGDADAVPSPRQRLRKNKRRSSREGPNGREPIPGSLPRTEEVHRPERCAKCGGDSLRVVGEEVVERYDYVSAHLRVNRTIRKTCSCNDCLARTTAEGPPVPYERASCTAGMLAWVAYAKFGLHLPLERLRGEFRRQGADLASSTLTDWIGRAADGMQPIYEAMERAILEEPVVQTDGTGLKVLETGRHKAHLGQMVVFCCETNAVYRYTPTKEGKHTLAFLEGYQGYVVADAASSYDPLYTDGRRVECGCNAHGRRKFGDAEETAPREAAEAIAWLAAIYDHEHRAKELGLDPDARLAHRQQHSAPLAADFRAWLNLMNDDGRALPKSPLRTAVRYYVRHGDALMRFLTDGRIPIDNNQSERLMKAIALGRKNYVFAGSDEGARRAAVLYSIVETCKLVGVDPLEYITDVLVRVVPHPANRGVRVEELLPWNWKRAHDSAAARDGPT